MTEEKRGGKTGKKKKMTDENSGHSGQGSPKWPTGSGKGSMSRFLGAPVNFCRINFLMQALLL